MARWGNGMPVDDTPRPAAHLAWQVVDDEVVLIDLKNRVARGLNRTGSAIWLLLDGRTTVTAIAQRVATELYGAQADEATVAADVDQFVGRLREKGLVA